MKAAFVVLVHILSLSLFAQTGSISGKVLEAGKPLEFVNVYLTAEGDTSKIITGAVTDSIGGFRIADLPASRYTLSAQMVGYSTLRLPVSVAGNQSANIGNLELSPDTRMLNTLVVSAMRNSIQKTEQGFSINASAYITQIGGTAADLLRNMPGVLVNADGELTLRGKTPLTLINGRVSGITGIDRAARLERIPANSIERVEIINNPSAKYDADSEGGVINIILKKGEDNGTNGAFAVGAGLGDRYRLNASVMLNHKSGPWNFGLQYDNWYTTRTRKVNGDRTNYYLTDDYYLTQRRFDERLIFYQNARATADFTPSDRDRFGFEFLWAFPGEDNKETLKNEFRTPDGTFTGARERYSNEIRRSHTMEFVLNYNRKFADPDKHLVAVASHTYGNDKEDTDITNQSLTEQGEELNDVFLQRTHTYQKTGLTNLSLDYAEPVSSKGLAEAGFKSIFRSLNADYERSSQVNGDYVIDPLNTNIFKYDEQIHAAYVQYTGWTGEKDAPRWKYIAGLRGEKVLNNGSTQDQSTAFENNYFNLFPSANLFYYTKDQNYIKLSYSRRINRPGLGQLNPFTDITDSLNQRAGNPRLKPELVHSIELGYTHSWNKSSLTLTTFYRQRNDAIYPYTVLDSNGVAFTRPLNFGRAVTEGVELIAGSNPFQAWGLNFSFSAFNVHIDDEGDVAGITNDRISWYTRLINNFSLYRNGKLQVIGNYTSPAPIPQGESIEVYYIDLGFQQQIMKGKGRLGLTFTDVFNTQKSGFITADSNFHFSRIFKLDTRAVMVTFGYAFGTAFKEKLMENRFKNE